MTNRKQRIRTLASIAPYLLSSLATFGQTASSPANTAPAAEETIELNPFLVTTQATGRYQLNESASGSRISQNIMDSSSTMATVTRDMIDDLGGGSTLKIARYIAGISDSTIPDALDRITIRGFQTDGQRIDGFTYEGQAAYDQAPVDRVEVIKGPNALLLPSGTPGGTINQVSKSPLFKQQGYITVQGGHWDSNRMEADVTGPLSKDFAYRIVTAYQDSKGYNQRSFHDSLIVSPSFTWKLSPSTQLTVHGEYYNFRVNSSGLPLDFATVGTKSDFRILSGVPLDYSVAMPGDFRKERREATWFLLTSKINDRLSVRLAGRASQVSGPTMGFGFGPATATRATNNYGAVDPLTGNFTPGIIYPSPTFTPTPALPIALWLHTGSYQTNIYRREDLQNDYVYQYDFPFAKTTTLAGFAYGYYSNNRVNKTATMPDVVNPFDPATFDSWFNAPQTWGAINLDQQLRYNQFQKYVTESVQLWKDKIILNGGVANFSFNGYIVNKIGTSTPLSPGSGDVNTVNYGAVFKPIANISLYYGHTENAAPTTSFNVVAAGLAPKFSVGKDDEAGIKIQLLDQRVFIMIDHYDIHQSAFGIGNPANNTVPPPPTPLPTLYSTRHAKGWEYQVTGSLTKQLSLSANFTHFENRDPNNIPFRTTAEKSGGIYVHYEFTDGMMKGFAAGVGVNYMSDSPGDAASGYTTATVPVPVQPSFYYPAHTVTDLNFSYTRAKLIYRLNIYNVTDEVYYNGGGSRTSTNVATPLNISASVTYKF